MLQSKSEVTKYGVQRLVSKSIHIRSTFLKVLRGLLVKGFMEGKSTKGKSHSDRLYWSYSDGLRTQTGVGDQTSGPWGMERHSRLLRVQNKLKRDWERVSNERVNQPRTSGTRETGEGRLDEAFD